MSRQIVPPEFWMQAKLREAEKRIARGYEARLTAASAKEAASLKKEMKAKLDGEKQRLESRHFKGNPFGGILW